MTTAPALAVITLAPRDVPVLRLALPILTATLKTARKHAAALGLSLAPFDALMAGTAGIAEVLAVVQLDADVALPAHLARSTRIALALEYDQVVKLRTKETDLLLDGDETSARIAHLDRLLRLLDAQGELDFPPPGTAGEF